MSRKKLALRLDDLKAEIDRARRILISTHLLPDGDGLGAETALYHYLKQAKKECRILNPDPVPERYSFLDPRRSVLKSYHPNTGRAFPWKTCDLWIIIDTNDPRRLGILWNDFVSRAERIVFLDHHTDLIKKSQALYPSHCRIVSDPGVSSIGELLYQLFEILSLTSIDSKMAEALYVSIMTDTNSFRYRGTTPLSHQISAHLLSLGVNPEAIYQAIYSSKKVSHLKLLGHLLLNVQTTASGSIAWLELSLKLRNAYGATTDDTLSFLNLLLLIEKAEVICLFREEEDGSTRVSMKSKGRVRLDLLAMKLGGGGHRFAAGVALSLSLKKSVAKVLNALSPSFPAAS